MGGMKLSGEDFAKLRDVIYDACGIYFADNKRYFLEARLIPRLQAHGLQSFSEYYRLIIAFSGSEERRILLDSITTHETSFFREMPQFNALKQEIFPTLIAQRQSVFKRVRIWSAACSSGEEPYTIAMLINEDAVLGKPPWQVELVATDLSQTILARAQRGVYSEYALRNTPRAYASKYFTKVANEYHIKPEIKSHVQFSQLNLCDAARTGTMRNFDIIFCRNTLIYFDITSKTKVVESLYNSLSPGGCLFISMTESLFGLNNRFSTARAAGAVFYRKSQQC